ncbi:MAG: hypothetical protein EPO36_10890 [Chloroflexota bacterium]|nr:MAG: hypothetical protein EPO36_10890 [Chloroflexota bacterium]
MARSVARSLGRAVIATLVLAALVSPVSTLAGRGAAAAGPLAASDTTTVVDTTAPTAPTDFRVVSRTRSGAITLGWTASYDAVGVAGYRLYRNGAWLGTLTQAGVDLIGTVMYDRLGGRFKTAVTYDLYAFDAAGNVSAPATLVVTP